MITVTPTLDVGLFESEVRGSILKQCCCIGSSRIEQWVGQLHFHVGASRAPGGIDAQMCMYWQPIGEMKWHGQNVLVIDGSLSDMENALPTFSRKKFTSGHALNEYLDLILRDPIPGDEREVPVATVSKRYFLIQHHSWPCRRPARRVGSEHA